MSGHTAEPVPNSARCEFFRTGDIVRAHLVDPFTGVVLEIVDEAQDLYAVSAPLDWCDRNHAQRTQHIRGRDLRFVERP